MGAECDANDLLAENCDLVGEKSRSGEQTTHFGGGDYSMKH